MPSTSPQLDPSASYRSLGWNRLSPDRLPVAVSVSETKRDAT
ncbi:hypothetical protein [Kamptonema formosum]|nr:hypothetical protein [Oscillatoria sp. PCC 10802]